MVPADDDAAHGFNVHHSGNNDQRQNSLVEQGAEEYQKDTHIAAHAETLAAPDAVAHEAVVFIRRIAHHKGTDDRQKSSQ